MNKEDFVTYEQALALKKLGFREECFYHYDPDGIIYSNYYICNEVFQHVLSCQLYKSYNEEELKGICDAPTLAQVQNWLRLNYNHYIEVSYDENFYRYKNRIVRNGAKEIYKSKIIYSSPEEALSAGITESIKFIN